MTFLLDVNVLIALLDDEHVSHDKAHEWFGSAGSGDWATCPITQNGVIRILGSARYPSGPRNCTAVAGVLAEFCSLPGHKFWPDELTILDSTYVDVARLPTSAHLTDTYLLALAAARGGQLATFDRRLSSGAVRGGGRSLHVIA